MLTQSQVYAWGPDDRPTYTNANPADFAVFNSITDNAAVGDERNFVRVREANTSDNYVDELQVVPGKEYEVFIYYHNNAASSTNEAGYGVATDVRIATAYPTTISPGERGIVSGIVSWNYLLPGDEDNPHNGSVWDEAYLTTETPNTVLRYKTGTAVIHNSGETDQSVLSTDIFTDTGTYIGYDKLIGVIPGCAEYSGYITYTLVVEDTSGKMNLQMSNDSSELVYIIALCIIAGGLVYYIFRKKKKHI